MSPTLKPAAVAALALLSGTGAEVAGQPGTPGTALTIYSSAAPGAISPEAMRTPGRGALPGYGVVRQERDLDFGKGRNAVRFSDVAALIDPTTVVFDSLTDAKGTTVLEQNYQFDLVSTDKLLQRYVDRPIVVDQVRGQGTESFSGTLLSTQGGLVLKRDDGSVQILPHYAGVKLPSLPGGLITRPTLVWDVSAQRAGTHRTRVSYQTQGMTWWADYNVTYAEGASANSCSLDIGAWVSIVNQSGASYPDAKLKLVAGEVHRVTRGAGVSAIGGGQRSMADEASAAPGFSEKAFFEYHLYTLGRPPRCPTTRPSRSSSSAARRVPCEKVLVYYGQAGADYGFLPSPGDRPQLRHAGQPQGRRLPGVPQQRGQQPGHAAAGRPHARVEARPRGRDARVHRRGRDRAHAAQREGAAEARQRLRRGRRAAPGRLPRRHVAQDVTRRSRSSCATTRRSA